MRMPRDRTGDNPAWTSTAPYWDDYYCVWDTWRTLFPLHVLLHPDLVRDNLHAFADRLQHNGQVGDAFIGGNERAYKWVGRDRPEWLGNQGGDDVDNIIADAYVKGVPGVDWPAVYRIVKTHADQERAAAYRAQDRGWIPFRKYSLGLYCSRTLEYAYNDDCAAALAAGLGFTNDAARWTRRSHGWENLWNPQAVSDDFTGFITPRNADGTWVPFDPKRETTANSPGGTDRCFYEGSAWIYSYFMPHDFPRLITLSGGPARFCQRLQYALQNDLIDFSNEPSFLTLYSFIYAGRPDLCTEWVRRNAGGYGPDHFPGDEDSGAMSAWYVWAALGLMPNAGQDIYLLSGPFQPQATITLANGRQILIAAENLSPQNIYVQSLTVNGRDWPQAWLRHRDLQNGAVLHYVMGPQPSSWGQKIRPPGRTP